MHRAAGLLFEVSKYILLFHALEKEKKLISPARRTGTGACVACTRTLARSGSSGGGGALRALRKHWKRLSRDLRPLQRRPALLTSATPARRRRPTRFRPSGRTPALWKRRRAEGLTQRPAGRQRRRGHAPPPDSSSQTHNTGLSRQQAGKPPWKQHT